MPVWDEHNPGPRRHGSITYGIEDTSGNLVVAFELDSHGNITVNGIISGNFALAGSDFVGANALADAITVHITGDSQKRLIVNADGKLEWGNGTTGVDTDLRRIAPGKLGTSGTFDVGGPINAHDYISNVAPNAGGYCLLTYVDGEPDSRFLVYADGKHEWGDGTDTPPLDTNLYRAAPGVVATDGTFTAGVALTSVGQVNGASIATDGTTVGATQATRFVGATLTGAPTSGTHLVGDFITTHDANVWICTAAGTPGTWIRVPNSTVAQERITEIKIFDADTVTAAGDGATHFCIPSPYNGLNLIDADIYVTTPASLGAVTVQVRNVTQAADMLTTRMTIDTGETTSFTAAAPPVIDTANDDVATGDIIAIDVDVAGTGSKGLGVILRWG
jgi:hypothetical protein